MKPIFYIILTTIITATIFYFVQAYLRKIFENNETKLTITECENLCANQNEIPITYN